MGGVTPSTFWQGFLSGIGHPVLGLDHLVFMLGIALLLALAGAPAARAALFALASVAGTALVSAAGGVVAAEWGVAVSLLAAALLLAAQGRSGGGTLLALLLAGGLVHGGALAETVVGAEPTPIAAYLVGLALMQAALAAGFTRGATRLLAARPGTAVLLPRVAAALSALVGIAGIGGLVAG